MSGGGSDDPNVYSDAILVSQNCLAPTTVLIGFWNNRLCHIKNPKV
jgi:hypothetical protein